MSHFKGSGLLFLRKEFKNRGEAVEKKFLDSLTPEETETFQKVLAVSWVPVDVAAQLYQKSASALFPNDRMALRRLGMMSANHDLKSIYKIMIRIATVSYVIGQAASLWRTYWDKGQASTEKEPNSNTLHYILKDYMDFPSVFHETMCGYVQAVVELTGGKNVNVNCSKLSNEIRWTVTWN